MFYIFRYTILRHRAIRFLLAPIYAICSSLVYKTLCNPAPVIQKSNHNASLRAQIAETRNQKEFIENLPSTPTVSFTLTLLVATALSLITAPLVEPRYFIVPWVIWRLNIPMAALMKPDSEIKTSNSRLKYMSWFINFKKEGSSMYHNQWLWLETIWLIIINSVTGYIFLYKGFEWPQEPGKVQRFMW